MCVQGPTKGAEYFAGYILEQSLSVDNLFVFIVVFKYFRVPRVDQDKARLCAQAQKIYAHNCLLSMSCDQPLVVAGTGLRPDICAYIPV